MKELASILLLLAISSESVAAEPRATPYLRCAAISYIGYRELPDQAHKERYRTAFDLHSKWASWFYPNDYETYKTDAGNVLVSIQKDIASNRLSAKQVADEAGSCLRLQTRTAVTFMECLKVTRPTKEGKEFCAKRSVGL